MVFGEPAHADEAIALGIGMGLTAALSPESLLELGALLVTISAGKAAYNFVAGSGDSKVKPPLMKSASTGSPMFDPDWEPDDDHLKKYEKYKKQDGSGRYECDKAESPVWKELKNSHQDKRFNAEKFKTNGLKGSAKRIYRWDFKHKDVEVYDGKGRDLGSLDPVTGKLYRSGTYEINHHIMRLLK